ncbi:hypothetical protein KIPB_014811, partial [Kipferlia bialata]|eukprot:g14811.t1
MCLADLDLTQETGIDVVLYGGAPCLSAEVATRETHVNMVCDQSAGFGVPTAPSDGVIQREACI